MQGAGGGDRARTAKKGKGRTASGQDTREEKVLGLPRSPRHQFDGFRRDRYTTYRFQKLESLGECNFMHKFFG